MKIQYKSAIVMTLFGVSLVIVASSVFGVQNYRMGIDSQKKNIKYLSQETASHLQSHLLERAAISLTLSTAPIIKSELQRSNNQFLSLSGVERKNRIRELNQRWQNTSDITDPFIADHMQNQIAEYLLNQQIILPGNYGEIFLTNRFGVMIATTGKLTTLSHAHKYWWQAAYNDGKGRVFFDDRGFDKSVSGYVLGVVVPIKFKNEIIGILKCNYNISGPLTSLIHEFNSRKIGSLKIVRTSGVVVKEYGTTPLSTKVNNTLTRYLQQKNSQVLISDENNEKQFFGIVPIPITLGSNEYGFGGSTESIDHIKGNKGDAWHIIIEAPEDVHSTTKLLFIFGSVFTLLSGVVALILGKKIAKPIAELSITASKIGQGKLTTRATVNSRDEVGILARSINSMTGQLQEAETSKKQLITDLQKALSEVKMLKGFIPICSSCKDIRDDKGYWSKIEKYIEDNTDAKLTHGMCNKCAEKLYGDEPWLDDYLKRGKSL